METNQIIRFNKCFSQKSRNSLAGNLKCGKCYWNKQEKESEILEIFDWNRLEEIFQSKLKINVSKVLSHFEQPPPMQSSRTFRIRRENFKIVNISSIRQLKAIFITKLLGKLKKLIGSFRYSIQSTFGIVDGCDKLSNHDKDEMMIKRRKNSKET